MTNAWVVRLYANGNNRMKELKIDSKTEIVTTCYPGNR